MVTDSRRERWLDDAAGPLVRPFAMTGGRTRARGESFDVVTILVTTGRPVPPEVRLSPEQRRLLSLCRGSHTVADLASESDLPLCVVEVLVGDLLQHGLLEVARQEPAARPDESLLRRVLNELRAL